jgi:inner membrane protein
MNPNAQPVFYYDLTHPDNNKLIVQRGRFKNWNAAAVNDFVRRMFFKYTID